MLDLTERERRLGIAYFFATSLLTLLWWVWIDDDFAARRMFLGEDFAGTWHYLVFFLADTVAAGVGGLLIAVCLLRKSPLAAPLACMHFGAQGYAWAMTLVLASRDDEAIWGLAAMTFSAGVALAFAIRFSSASILWGPFRFGLADSDDVMRLWRGTLLQTATMWLIFLVGIPAGIYLFEGAFFRRHAIPPEPWHLPFTIGLFVAAGSVGIYSGWRMVRDGMGTPLPAHCAKQLVVSGPYRHIRNPMATCGILQGLAVGLALGSPLIIVYALVGGFWWEILARHLEERDLLSRFGEAYGHYRGSVPCWRPRLTPYRPK